ncbi:hypothetical protein DL93DRAFT_2229075 [Clavulina sp. PMI_390]|nr:hypothetical protein DL93DRAFT_2229075 [Clavulina sp. PMI_390]
MLPVTNRGKGQKDSALGAAYGVITSYKVHSNDVLDGQLRVTVEEENTGRSVWFSERMLTDNEIIETLKETASQRVRWSIHRPKSGWYIRLRAPLFPPNASVSLLPVEAPEAPAGSGTLSFLCQTRIDLTPPPPAYGTPSANPAQPRMSQSSDHSYPPSSPSSPIGSAPYSKPNPSSPLAVNVDVDPAASTTELLSSTTVASTSSLLPSPVASTNPNPPAAAAPGATGPKTTADPRVRSEVTRFFVKPMPLGTTTQPGAASSRLSFLPAAMSMNLMGSLGTPHHSFTIQTSSGALPPVLTYHDTTPFLSAARSTGTIELDHGVARCLGVEPSWWIAVALAYVEFLEARDGYLAASDG